MRIQICAIINVAACKTSFRSENLRNHYELVKQGLHNKINALQNVCEWQQRQLEAVEHEERRNNVVVIGVPESRASAEKQRLVELCTTMEGMHVNADDVMECFRLGNQTCDKTRAIQVKFTNSTIRNHL